MTPKSADIKTRVCTQMSKNSQPILHVQLDSSSLPDLTHLLLLVSLTTPSPPVSSPMNSTGFIVSTIDFGIRTYRAFYCIANCFVYPNHICNIWRIRILSYISFVFLFIVLVFKHKVLNKCLFNKLIFSEL